MKEMDKVKAEQLAYFMLGYIYSEAQHLAKERIAEEAQKRFPELTEADESGLAKMYRQILLDRLWKIYGSGEAVEAGRRNAPRFFAKTCHCGM